MRRITAAPEILAEIYASPPPFGIRPLRQRLIFLRSPTPRFRRHHRALQLVRILCRRQHWWCLGPQRLEGPHFSLTNFYNSNGVFIGGGQMGGNYQIGNFVIGGEWDFDWAPNNKDTKVSVPGFAAAVAALPSLPFAPAPTGPPPSVPSPVTGINHWITTVAARFGYAVDNWLFYGKAGGGWIGNNNWTITDVTTGVSLTCGNFTNNCGNNTGWLVGAGYEYAFTNNWMVRLEYDYLFWATGPSSFRPPPRSLPAIRSPPTTPISRW